MARFQTHVNAGIFLSGGAVLALHGLGLVPRGETFTLFALGVVGSLLPDIDAADSAPVRAFFGALGAVLAFAWTLPMVGTYDPLRLILAWCGLFLAVRLLFHAAFARFTVHRGIWHSWLAAAFAGLATVNGTHRLLDWPADTAWVAGLMVAFGYLGHLALDELSSVDLQGARVRRSFGTALKPFSLSSPLSSLAMAAAVAALAWLAPEARWIGLAAKVQWSHEAAKLAANLAERLRVLLN